MSYEVGCCGVWGVEVTEENVGQTLHRNIREAVADWEDDPPDGFLDDCVSKFRNEVFWKLIGCGIKIPDNAGLFIVESDGAPGRCDTSPGTILVGIGMTLEPWRWPPVDESFMKVARLHTWVWGG